MQKWMYSAISGPRAAVCGVRVVWMESPSYLSASATLVSVVPVQCELFSVQRTTVDGGNCPLDGASDDRGQKFGSLPSRG